MIFNTYMVKIASILERGLRNSHEVEDSTIAQHQTQCGDGTLRRLEVTDHAARIESSSAQALPYERKDVFFWKWCITE